MSQCPMTKAHFNRHTGEGLTLGMACDGFEIYFLSWHAELAGLCLSDFWDTAGQERFQSMHASYYHKAHACIMVRALFYLWL